MHKRIGKLAALAALSVAFCLALTVQTNAQGFIGEMLKRMNDHNKSLQSLQADVTMVKYESVLRVIDTYEGEVWYLPEVLTGKQQHELKMRLDWKSENGRSREESISVNGDDFELWNHDRHQVMAGKIQKSKDSSKINTVFGFMGMGRTQLRANYTFDYLGDEEVRGGVKTIHVRLNPKVKMSYKSAELWVDADGMPVQAKIVEKNDDSTTVLLSHLQKNETIKEAIFTLEYDRKKVKITKM